MGDRVTVEFVMPEDEEGTPFAEYWTNDWERKGATLHRRDSTYHLHVAVEKEVEPADSADDSTENGVVLGVDLNVDGYLAVTSTGAFLGNADYLNQKRDEYERRRGNLQQTGTRSAHLTIKSIGGGVRTILTQRENPAVYGGRESRKPGTTVHTGLPD